MSQGGIERRGLMLVLSSPSGAGKTTISRALLARDGGLMLSVSATTRPKRPGETEGVDYVFMDQARFDGMVRDGAFLEHATVFGHCYGTPSGPVEAALDAGRDVLFDIDWQGAQQVAEKAREDLVSVFILPPSTAELERRLHTRAQDSDDVVRARMAKAADEMSHWAEYDYIVVNEDVEASVAAVGSILEAERLRRERRIGLHDFVEVLRRGS
ncbi:MAG: guanylate kinase [Proteobacteria bacterium]|nr:guanylate kinase [Pseudomonadota bacterium]